MREEVEACKALGRVDVLLTHEAPKPFWIELAVVDGAVRNAGGGTSARRRSPSWPTRCSRGCTASATITSLASFERAGIPTVCVDRVNRSYLLVDADTFAWESASRQET